jgi:hypothetical protein
MCIWLVNSKKPLRDADKQNAERKKKQTLAIPLLKNPRKTPLPHARPNAKNTHKKIDLFAT